MKIENSLELYLSKNSFSATKTRKQIFKCLRASSSPLSIKEICLLNSNIDHSTIYRTIDLFVKIGIAKRIWQGLKSKIELTDAFSPHHHHAACTNCGSVESLSNSNLEKILVESASSIGFKMNNHEIEIVGLCRKCH
jgi:Fe2+ or Zn2+ uptake regulation protein